MAVKVNNETAASNTVWLSQCKQITFPASASSVPPKTRAGAKNKPAAPKLITSAPPRSACELAGLFGEKMNLEGNTEQMKYKLEMCFTVHTREHLAKSLRTSPTASM